MIIIIDLVVIVRNDHFISERIAPCLNMDEK